MEYINLCYAVLMSSEKCYFSCCTRTNKQIVSDPILYLFHSFLFFKYIFAITFTFSKKLGMKRQYLKLRQEITFRSRTHRLKKKVKKRVLSPATEKKIGYSLWLLPKRAPLWPPIMPIRYDRFDQALRAFHNRALSNLSLFCPQCHTFTKIPFCCPCSGL